MKVVLVDDSIELRNLVKDLLADVPALEIAGEAGDAPEAIDLITALRPDAVILDISLPSGSGIGVLRRIKQLQPAPLVIVLTGLGTPEYRIACENAGADYYFDKTSDLDALHMAMIDMSGRFRPLD
jgi:DNA-binding NarL/FixJ family response regulator